MKWTDNDTDDFGDDDGDNDFAVDRLWPIAHSICHWV